MPATATTEATFRINSTKLYVPEVTSSINDNINFLEKLKQGFKRITPQIKCRSEITQLKNSNSDHMIDLTFRNFIRLFIQLFKAGEHDSTRNFF